MVIDIVRFFSEFRKIVLKKYQCARSTRLLDIFHTYKIFACKSDFNLLELKKAIIRSTIQYKIYIYLKFVYKVCNIFM